MKIGLYRKYNAGVSCEAAMEFYKRAVFGIQGEWKEKMTWGNPGKSGMTIADPEKDGEKIMHMGTPLTKSFQLFGCDGGVKMAKGGECADSAKKESEEKKSDNEAAEAPKKENRADEYSLWIAADSREHADKLFADLSADGGKVSMPIGDMFWGDYFGVCNDKFGTGWMVCYGESHGKDYDVESKFSSDKLQVNVYRSFTDGNCAKAFDFYKTIFGGDFSWKGTYENAPGGSEFAPKNDDDKAKIMHMSLPLTKQFTLMGCDIVPTTMESNDMPGANDDDAWAPYAMSLMLATKEDSDKVFEDLKADGGKVVMPLEDQFWGDYFGVVCDKFGNHWNVSWSEMNAKLIAGEEASATKSETKKNKMKANIYRMFQGNCAEAFDFYKSVFGGDFSWKVDWSKAPADTIANLERDGNKIMHMGLPLTDGLELMGCDEVEMKQGEQGHVVGSDAEGTSNKRQKMEDGTASIPPSSVTKNMHISICPESKEHADELLAKLSADGGVVQMPLAQQFWGSYFGMCMDRFGTQWMLDYASQTPHSAEDGEKA